MPWHQCPCRDGYWPDKSRCGLYSVGYIRQTWKFYWTRIKDIRRSFSRSIKSRLDSVYNRGHITLLAELCRGEVSKTSIPNGLMSEHLVFVSSFTIGVVMGSLSTSWSYLMLESGRHLVKTHALKLFGRDRSRLLISANRENCWQEESIKLWC